MWLQVARLWTGVVVGAMAVTQTPHGEAVWVQEVYAAVSVSAPEFQQLPQP